MRDPTVFLQHFSLLDFTHYNHRISKNTERGCDPSLWFLTSTPPLIQYFTQALSELKCWARGHFPSAHLHGFLFIKNARPFGQVQEYQSVHLLIEASLLLFLIDSWQKAQWLAKPKLHMTKELELNDSYNFNNKLAITMLGFCGWFLGCCYGDFMIFCSLDSRLNVDSLDLRSTA